MVRKVCDEPGCGEPAYEGRKCYAHSDAFRREWEDEHRIRRDRNETRQTPRLSDED